MQDLAGVGVQNLLVDSSPKRIWPTCHRAQISSICLRKKYTHNCMCIATNMYSRRCSCGWDVLTPEALWLSTPPTSPKRGLERCTCKVNRLGTYNDHLLEGVTILTADRWHTFVVTNTSSRGVAASTSETNPHHTVQPKRAFSLSVSIDLSGNIVKKYLYRVVKHRLACWTDI